MSCCTFRRTSGLRRRTPVVLLVVCWWGVASRGADPPKVPPILARDPGPPAVHPAVPRERIAASPVVSDRVRALVAAKLPAYVPPAHPMAAEAPESDAIKLPPIFVTAPKFRVPIPDQMLTREAFAARLRQLFPGASVPGQDPYRVEHGLPNYARLEYEWEKRAEAKAAFGSFADVMEQTGDHKQAQQLRKELQRLSGSTYKDPLLDAMDRSANGGRR